MRAVGGGSADHDLHDRRWQNGAWRPRKRRPYTPEEQAARNARVRERRAAETDEVREARLVKRRADRAAKLAAESPEEREQRFAKQRVTSRRQYVRDREKIIPASVERNRRRRRRLREEAADLTDGQRMVRRAAEALVVKVPGLVPALLDPPAVAHPGYLRWADAVRATAVRHGLAIKHADTVWAVLVMARALDKEAQAGTRDGRARTREEGLVAILDGWTRYRRGRRQDADPTTRTREARRGREALTEEQRQERLEHRRRYLRDWKRRHRAEMRIGPGTDVAPGPRG